MTTLLHPAHSRPASAAPVPEDTGAPSASTPIAGEILRFAEDAVTTVFDDSAGQGWWAVDDDATKADWWFTDALPDDKVVASTSDVGCICVDRAEKPVEDTLRDPTVAHNAANDSDDAGGTDTRAPASAPGTSDLTDAQLSYPNRDAGTSPSTAGNNTIHSSKSTNATSSSEAEANLPGESDVATARTSATRRDGPPMGSLSDPAAVSAAPPAMPPSREVIAAPPPPARAFWSKAGIGVSDMGIAGLAMISSGTFLIAWRQRHYDYPFRP